MADQEKPAPAEGAAPAAGDAVTETVKEVVDGTPKALGGVFVGSLMVMVKAAKQCDDLPSGSDCDDYLGWALACAVIGLVLSLTMIILLMCKPDFKTECSTAFLVMVIFLAALWIAGVGTMTFKSPYKGTAGNGYFGAWIAAFSAVSLLTEALKSVCDDMKSKVGDGAAWNWWFVLTAASIVATAQSAIDCDEAATCEKELAWALAASAISLVLCLVMIILACACEKATSGTVWKWMSLGLVLWWMCGTGVSTYEDGPYTSMGNGYFSMWIALIASFQLFGIVFFTENGEAEAAVEDAAKKAMAGNTGHITALLLFSTAVLIAAGIICNDINDLPNGECKDYEAWAVAASAVSLIITLFLLIAVLGQFLPTDVWDILLPVCGALLLCIWLAGTYTMTFKRPFKVERGNGYFGAWLALITAWMLATAVVPGLKGAMEKLTQYGGWAYQVMGIGSLILGVQAAHDCNDFDCGENHYGYAVAAGWISFVLVILVFILIGCDCWNRIAAIVFGIFFAVWWTAAAYVLTYDKGYLSLGNGYIGIWLATVCSYLILLDVWLRDGDGTDVEKTEEVKAVEGAVPTTTENEPAQD